MLYLDLYVYLMEPQHITVLQIYKYAKVLIQVCQSLEDIMNLNYVYHTIEK